MKNRNFFRPARPLEADTNMLRSRLEKDVADFEARGGIIEKIDSGVRGTPVIQTRRKLNHAQIKTMQAKKAGAQARDEEE